MKKILLYTGIILTLLCAAITTCCISGCGAEYKANRCEKRIAKDEIKCPNCFTLKHDSSIKIVNKPYRHDTTIYIPGQNHTDTFSVPCPDANNYTKTTHYKGGYSTLDINKGIAIVICHDDSLKALIKLWQDSTYYYKTVNTSGLATKTITTNVLTGFQTFCYWLVVLSMVGLALYFGGKYVLPLAIKAIKPKL